MRWAKSSPVSPRAGDVRFTRKFAFLPTRMYHGDHSDLVVWLEFYSSRQRYSLEWCKGSSDSKEYRWVEFMKEAE